MNLQQENLTSLSSISIGSLINYQNELVCPITMNLLQHPTTIKCGHTFQKSFLINAIQIKPQCPLCRKPATVNDLIQNFMVKNLISTHKATVKKKLNPQNLSSSEKYSVIVIGDSSVGKSCLISQHFENKFLNNTNCTISVQPKTLCINAFVKLQVWDTPGQERYKSLTRSQYRDKQAVLLVFDLTEKKTYENLQYWTLQIQQFAKQNIPIILIGNKLDLVINQDKNQSNLKSNPRREVSKQEGQKFAKQHGMFYYECSAKNSDHAKLIFYQISKQIEKRIQNKSLIRSRPKGEKINSDNPSHRKTFWKSFLDCFSFWK